MRKIKINKISVDIVWELLWKGWDLARVNYPLTLLIVAIYSLSISLSAIPLLGAFATSIAGCIAPLIFLQAASFWEKGNPSNFKDVFSILNNKPVLNIMMPLLVINFIFGFIPNVVASIPVLSAFASILVLISLPVAILVGLAYPILFFNQEKIDFKESLSLAFEGLIKNLIPFIVGGFLMGVLFFFCAVALVLPIFFIAAPVFITYPYLWYRVVYEDLVIEVDNEDII